MGFNYISQLSEDFTKVIQRCKEIFSKIKELTSLNSTIEELTIEKNNLGGQMTPFEFLQRKLSYKPEVAKAIEDVILENTKRMDEITNLLQQKEEEKKSIEAEIKEIEFYVNCYQRLFAREENENEIAKSLNLLDLEEVAVARWIMTTAGGYNLKIPEEISEEDIKRYLNLVI